MGREREEETSEQAEGLQKAPPVASPDKSGLRRAINSYWVDWVVIVFVVLGVMVAAADSCVYQR